MATERKFLSNWIQKLKKRYPDAFVYKIPDGKIGGMRPFDLIVIHDTYTFCIEAKRDSKQKLTEYQIHSLQKAANNGALSMVLTPENANEVLDRMETGKWVELKT